MTPRFAGADQQPVMSRRRKPARAVSVEGLQFPGIAAAGGPWKIVGFGFWLHAIVFPVPCDESSDSFFYAGFWAKTEIACQIFYIGIGGGNVP